MKKIELYAAIAALIIASLELYSSFNPDYWNWGFDHLKYFSPFFRIAFFSIVIISVIPFFNRRIGLAVSYIYGKLFKPSVNRIVFLLSPAIFFAVFWLFRTNRFYGDFWLEGARLQNSWIYLTNPLYDYINHFLFAFTKSAGLGRFETIAFASVLYGVLFMFFLFKLANKLYKEKIKKFFIISFIATTGTMQLFFGNVEVEASIVAATIIYIFFSYLFIKENSSILYPALALSVGIALKFSMAAFIPSLFYLYAKKTGRGIGIRCFLNKDFVKLAAAFIIPILIVLFAVYFFTWKGNPPLDASERYGSLDALMCYGGACSPLPPDILFSRRHIIETANEHILFSPLGLVLLAFLLAENTHTRNKKNKSSILNKIKSRSLFNLKEPFFVFLIIMTLFSMLLWFTWVHSYEYRESWELATTSSIPYTLLASLLIIKNHSRSLKYLFVAIIILYIFHTLPWILSNSLSYSYEVTEAENWVKFTQIRKYII